MRYEEITANQTVCTGTRVGYNSPCRGTLYKCVCGNVGCKQTQDHACSEQGFSIIGRCYKCDAIGKNEAVPYS